MQPTKELLATLPKEFIRQKISQMGFTPRLIWDWTLVCRLRTLSVCTHDCNDSYILWLCHIA